MEQQEVLYVDQGQFNFRKIIPKIPRAIQLVFHDRKNFVVAISEIMTMSKEYKFHDLTFAYIFTDVFKNLNEEKLFSVLQPSDFFKEKINGIKRDHSGIEGISMECEEGIITFNVMLEQPDWDLEELIYNKYREVLNQYKDQPFDIRIRESLK